MKANEVICPKRFRAEAMSNRLGRPGSAACGGVVAPPAYPGRVRIRLAEINAHILAMIEHGRDMIVEVPFRIRRAYLEIDRSGRAGRGPKATTAGDFGSTARDLGVPGLGVEILVGTKSVADITRPELE